MMTLNLRIVETLGDKTSATAIFKTGEPTVSNLMRNFIVGVFEEVTRVQQTRLSPEITLSCKIVADGGICLQVVDLNHYCSEETMDNAVQCARELADVVKNVMRMATRIIKLGHVRKFMNNINKSYSFNERTERMLSSRAVDPLAVWPHINEYDGLDASELMLYVRQVLSQSNCRVNVYCSHTLNDFNANMARELVGMIMAEVLVEKAVKFESPTFRPLRQIGISFSDNDTFIANDYADPSVFLVLNNQNIRTFNEMVKNELIKIMINKKFGGTLAAKTIPGASLVAVVRVDPAASFTTDDISSIHSGMAYALNSYINGMRDFNADVFIAFHCLLHRITMNAELIADVEATYGVELYDTLVQCDNVRSECLLKQVSMRKMHDLTDTAKTSYHCPLCDRQCPIRELAVMALDPNSIEFFDHCIAYSGIVPGNDYPEREKFRQRIIADLT